MVYEAKIDKLDSLLAEVESTMEEKEVPLKITMAFMVAVEEIFVNIASYAYPDKDGVVDIDFSLSDNRAKIRFEDTGIAFNPLAKPDPDINVSAEERSIGGLGIYMVKKSMDGVDYHRIDDKNIFEFWKNF